MVFCPDSYENNSTNNTENFTNNTENSTNNTEASEDEQTVHFTFFVGYADSEIKINKLVNECHGHALLDSGCSKTVAGSQWYEKYYDELSDFDKQSVSETSSSKSSFKFRDGVTKKSIKRVTMPCYIDGKRATIESDIVDSNIPLLLSKKSMQKVKMTIDFGKDVAVIGESEIELVNSNSGHYLLPLF